MSPILLHVIAAALYLLVAFHFWRAHWRARGEKEITVRPWERWAPLAPLALHVWLLHTGIFTSEQLRFGFGQALSVMLALAVAIYWVESFFVRMDGLYVIVLPIAAVCVVLPAAFPGFAGGPNSESIGFRIHLVTAMAAYSLFTIAALQALLMSVLERRLHAGALVGVFGSLPPLLTLERILFRVIGIGFLLLSATLATGIFFSEQVFGQVMRFDHKTVFAIASWIIFALLLLGRWLYGWRGRLALRWILAGFATLLLAYIGSRFVMEVILHRGIH